MENATFLKSFLHHAEQASAAEKTVRQPVPSALELRFPRIARELALRWKTRDIHEYMDALLIDQRGDREGFPPDVQEELMLLSGVLWYLELDATPSGGLSVAERMSLSAMNERAVAMARTQGAWVL